MNEKTKKLGQPGYELRHTYNNFTRWGDLKVCIGPDYILFGVRNLCDMFGIKWRDTSTDRLYEISLTHKITVHSNNGKQKLLMLTSEGMRQWLAGRAEAEEFMDWIDSTFTEEVAQSRFKLFNGAKPEIQATRLMAWLVRGALSDKKAEQLLEAEKLLTEIDCDEVPVSVTEFIRTVNGCFGGKINRNDMFDVLLRSGYVWKHWPSGYSVVGGEESPYFESFLAGEDTFGAPPYVQLTQRGQMHFAKLFIDAYEQVVREE